VSTSFLSDMNSNFRSVAMFLSVNLQPILHILYLHTKFRMPWSNGSLVIKPKAKEFFAQSSCLLLSSMLQNVVKNVHIFGTSIAIHHLRILN
jgi:hypothetical protein